MKNIKIILVPKFLSKEELEAQGITPTATVEAEYGNSVIEGEKVTLAHHVKQYENNPAPCNTPNVPVLEDGSTIVISHIDLDTLGGIAALLGRKKEDPEFWQAAEFLDLNGVHHLHEVPEDVQDKYLAYSAWGENHRGARITEITDVTESVNERLDLIDRVVDRDPELIAQGRDWNERVQKAIEECLVYENDNVRVFNSKSGVFCNAAYFSPNKEKIIPATVSLNGKFKSVTMALADGGKEFQDLGMETSRELVQQLWGMEAGGHPGIAGSPRGREMTEEDLFELANLVDAQIEKAKDKRRELNGFTLKVLMKQMKKNQENAEL